MLMDVTTVPVSEEAVVLRVPPRRRFTDTDVVAIQSLNPELRLEVDGEGNLVAMLPAGAETSVINTELLGQLADWLHRDGSGIAFGSSAGFRLPRTGSLRSPDAAWMTLDRWRALPRRQRRRFARVCPDFVAELCEPTDYLEALHAKMREYRDNGARLGWLLDPESRTVWVYREDAAEPDELHDPSSVAGDPVLPGFVLDVKAVWRAAAI